MDATHGLGAKSGQHGSDEANSSSSQKDIIFFVKQGVSDILSYSGSNERRQEGNPVRLEESAEGTAGQSCCQADKPNWVVFCLCRHTFHFCLRISTGQFPMTNTLDDLLKVLCPSKIDYMLADFAHLRVRFSASSDHGDDGGMLTKGICRITAKSRSSMRDRLMNDPCICPPL